MILVRPGRHAYHKLAWLEEKQTKMGHTIFRSGWLISVLFTSIVMAGCPKKTPPNIAGSSYGSSGRSSGSSGVGESDLAAGGRVQDRVQGQGDGGGPLQDVLFAYNSFELSAEAQQVLQANADWLQSNTQAKVEVEGHCDDRGTVEYNLALGAKRARAARDYLITLGIPPERLSTISYGEELPQCTDLNESCWQQNRRNHFLVLR